MAEPSRIDDFVETVQRHASAVEAVERDYEIALLCTPQELVAKPYLATDRDVLVIDTLRNSTSITVALAAGASEVVLYGKRETSLEEMYQAADAYLGLKVVAGEIEGRPIPHAQCGNSPLDFTPAQVAGHRVFYSSTNNGSALQTLISLGRPRSVFWACLLNAHAVGRGLASGAITQPMLFLCAGFRGTLALEDLLCAGQILLIAQHHGFRPGRLDDGAQAALAIASVHSAPDGTLADPDELSYQMAKWRCGRVLEMMGQAHDIAATVVGRGIEPTLLDVVSRCIPTLKEASDQRTIVTLDAPLVEAPRDERSRL